MELFHEGFESGEWSHDVKVFPVGGDPFRTEVGNIFTPKNWLAWFLHDPGTYDQPEGRNVWEQNDPRRIHSGIGAYLLFSFWRHHDTGLMRQVQVEPGTRLRLTAYAHSWSNTSLPGHEACCDDGRCSCGVGRDITAIPVSELPEPSGDPWGDAVGNSVFSIGIDPTGGTDPFADTVEWGEAYVSYNGYTIQLESEVVAKGNTVTVFLRNITKWSFKHNDGYWDDVVLETIESEPPPYESTMLVLPQTATPEQLHEVFTLAFPDRRTFGFSHDDAGNLHGTSICFNIPDAERSAYLNFYATRYPDVTVEFAYTSDWEPVPDPPSGLLLCQCNPLWANEKIDSPTCSLTLCQTGCWITCGAMAQRFFGIKPDATPSTANKALGAAGGFSGCLTTWEGMKTLGLEVFERHYDNQRARDWLDGGNVCFAEVEPESYMHFVLVTRYQEGQFWMLDPYKNVEGWLDEYYPGVESWRSVCPYEESPLPTRGPLVSLHIQSLVEGILADPSDLVTLRGFEPSSDLPTNLREYMVRYQDTLKAAMGFVERVKPSVIKIFQLEIAKEIKVRSPETLVVLRYYLQNQDLSGDLMERAREYVAMFEDSLRVNAEWINYAESYNETIPSDNPEAIRRSVEFDCCFADALAELGLPVKPVLLNVPVGNPLESEVELLLPAVRKVIQYGGAIGYHGYGLAVAPDGNLNDAWQYFAGRALEGWDPAFRAHGLYPDYFIGESGAFASCADGWRSSKCLDGDWEVYLKQLQEFNVRLKAWNCSHGNRCLGAVLFTSGGWGWDNFDIQAAEMGDPNWPT